MVTPELADTTVWRDDVPLLFVSRISVHADLQRNGVNGGGGTLFNLDLTDIFQRVGVSGARGESGEDKDPQRGRRGDRSVCRFHDSKGCPSLSSGAPLPSFFHLFTNAPAFTLGHGQESRAGRSLTPPTSKPCSVGHQSGGAKEGERGG